MPPFDRPFRAPVRETLRGKRDSPHLSDCQFLSFAQIELPHADRKLSVRMQ
jgi:hypothetical protein